MTDDDIDVYMSQRPFWDVADDLFRLAINPFIVSGFMDCSMEYCVRLLRSLRFAYVVSMPRWAAALTSSVQAGVPRSQP